MANLFQKSVEKKYLNEINKDLLKEKFAKFQNHFAKTEIQQSIRGLKEEEYQEGFIRDLFVEVLGYTLKPQPNHNIELEKKNVNDSKKADGAIHFNEKVIAVIELKGTDTTDLKSVEAQAFGYKNNQPDCKYIITSNFEKLRFYINNAVDHEEFNLFNLTIDRFALLWICLAKENILSDLPLKIKNASVLKEENITKELYNDYSSFKHDLFRNIVKLNPGFDKLLLFKKSQKLLDRLLFIFFAEDKSLLPPNTITEIVKEWNDLKKLDEYKPLYDRIKKYFGYLNTGHKSEKHNIFAYNGGLFSTDDTLDNIIIDDEILNKHILQLSTYDFESEVDVNILGHIFEHSLNELDEIQSELEGKTIEKNKTKRKKDGVFYTPKYITKYIVENTVGKLCEEKKIELEIEKIDFAKNFILKTNRTIDKETEVITGKGTIQAIKKIKTKLSVEGSVILEKLEQYRAFLLGLTICDPACGSGAFLNQALDFLINEHSQLDENISSLQGHSFVFPDIENHILEKNLFGVDLNEESVEIARLSLWLRTAQPGRKLTTLSNNIKCGNSLIDDPTVAGEKAFNWQKEFPEVFANGGFSVVIGNPPYVRQELFKEIKPYLEKHYDCYNSIADLYTYFIEKGIELMNLKGKFSFILPNKFLKASYGSEIRKVIINKVQVDLIFDFDDYPIFADATTYPIIFVFSKEISNNKSVFLFSEINKRDNTSDPIGRLIAKAINASYNSLKGENWQLQDSSNDSLLTKIKSGSSYLKDLVNDKIFRGVSTGKNEVFIINKQIADSLINEKNKTFIREIVTGKEVKRYNLNFDNLYLLYIPWEYDLEFDEGIKNYLLKNKDLLSDRPEVKEGRFNWWCLSRYGSKNAEYLFKPKIIYPRINNECNFFFDTIGNFSLSDNNFFISTDEKYLLPILNSKIVYYFLKSVSSTLQGGYLDFRRPYVEIIPVKIPLNKASFSEKADLMLSLNNSLQELCQKFKRNIQRKFELKDLPNKLQNWYLLNYKDYIKELAKKKIKLSLSEEAEWEDYFLQESKKAIELKNKIDATDKEIDQMVYTLYGLSEEEIKIVEGI